jgi:hypothetical protein
MYERLVMWLVRRNVMKQRALLGRGYDPYVEDEVADGVANAWERWARIPGRKCDKRVLANCAIFAGRDAVRRPVAAGNLPASDAMRHLERPPRRKRHGTDEEVSYLDGEPDKSVPEYEYRAALENLCAEWREIGDCLLHGLTREQTAIVCGVSERTVRRRIADMQEFIRPNWYKIIVDTLYQELSPLWRMVFDSRVPIAA